MTCEI